jgi:ABC-type multidrug transport system fused ATPase/permease subunit
MKAYRLLIGDLIARLGWRFPALIALMSLVGLGEGAAVALLLPLLSGIGFAPASSHGPAIAILDKALAAVGAIDSVGILLVVIAISTIQTILFIALNWWMAKLGRHYQRQRQMELFRAFMQAKWSFVAGKKAGELTNVIVTECERLGVTFTLILSVISSLVVTLIYLGLLLLIAWPVTVSLVVFSLLGALAMTRLYRMSYLAGQGLAPLNAELQSLLGEQFSGAKIVKATASEDRATARIDPWCGGSRRPMRLSAFCRRWCAEFSSLSRWSASQAYSYLAIKGWEWRSAMSSSSLCCLRDCFRA